SKTVVLFWNTGCGFCQRMLPDLEEWEVTRPSGAPRLLVVSAGSEEEVRAMKLRSPVVMNPDFSVAQQYGAGGTPTGVLVDEEGYVASPVVAGAEAVLTLAKAETAIPAHP
ncbi:MAG: peroxiredoxin family protein, partial [Chloroflexota bacterium]